MLALALVGIFYQQEITNLLFKLKENNKPTTLKTTNMNWILGNWIRINDKETKSQTFEDWTKISETEYQGHGYVVENDTTVWEEHIRLFQENNEWNFDVSGVNETPTTFKITSFTKSSFISENQENDFPKIIEYTLENNTLKAKIPGGGPEIIFNFKRT